MAEVKTASEMVSATARLNGGGKFDINSSVASTRGGSAIFPSFGDNGRNNAQYDAYVALATQVMEGNAPRGSFLSDVTVAYSKAIHDSWDAFIKNQEELKKSAVSKAIAVPADFLTYARMSYMPDPTASNILPWPAVHPEAIRKIVMENLAPNLIIGMRSDDVMMYSQPSQHLWKPGWRMEMVQGNKTPSRQDQKDMREAEEFLLNSSKNFKNDDSIKRMDANLPDFAHFLTAIVRDTLTYDLVAISTDRNGSGDLLEFSPAPAGNIRFVGLGGYEGDKSIYAVAVDEGGSVRHKYERSELFTYVRNVRTDPEYSITMTRGYGTPEITTAMRLIQIFQNVIEFNADTFTRSGVPHGMMLLKGSGWNQKQVDVLTRMWQNLKHGISKVWALPVLAAPKDGEVEIVDFSRIKGQEAFYQDLLNLSIGCFCAVFRFPPHRLGYRISGAGPDTHRERSETPGRLIDDDDPGKVALLMHIEAIVNQMLVWPRWPQLKMAFTGKEPKADAREYEARKNAQTWGEARAEADLPALAELDVVKSNPKLKDIADVMDIAPLDPNMSGVFQSIAAALLTPEKETGEPGNNMTSTKDPAAARHHGKEAGIRRPSAREKGKTA